MASACRPCVIINVGGTRFEASEDTFNKSGYVALLLGKELSDDDMMDSDGHLFIDRDPELFAEVLRLLRGYRFFRHPRLTWSEVRAEADFYQVQVADCDSLAPHPRITLPPDMVYQQTVQLLFVGSNNTGNQWHISGEKEKAPADVLKSMNPGNNTPLQPDTLIRLGFSQGQTTGPDQFAKTLFHRKVRVVSYDKFDVVPSVTNELVRDASSDFVQVSYSIL